MLVDRGRRVRFVEHALLTAERLADAALGLVDPDLRAAASDALARSLTAQGRWSEPWPSTRPLVGHGETPDAATAWPPRDGGGPPELARPLIARAIESV